MRTPRPGSEHRETVSRRLALLGAELSAVRATEGSRTAGAPAGDGVPDPALDTHTRIRMRGSWGPGDSESVASWDADGDHGVGLPAPIPVPGRHAARRRRMLVPEVASAVRLGPAQLTVVAVLVALGLAVTTWWVVRSDAEEAPLVSGTAPPLVTPAAEGGAPSPGSAAAGSALPASGMPHGPSAGSGPTELVVDVAGRVRRPGIAVLAPGSRVIDAIEAAGGARPGVDLTSLNLARLLVDGEQILVGRRAATPGVPSAVVPGPGAQVPTLLVNLNTAGPAELEALPEVGPVTAQAIIAWRESHGGFSAVDQLLDVDGIGEATLSQLAPFVTV